LTAFQNALRIARCMKEIYIHRKDGIAVRNSVLLERCLKAHSWEDSVNIFRQLRGIGASYTRILALKGVRTLAELRQIEPETLEVWCHRNSPFGREIKDELLRIPSYDITIRTASAHTIASERVVKVVLEVKIGLLNGKLTTKMSQRLGWTTFLGITRGELIKYQRFLYVPRSNL
jgi:hypothetical protein